MQIGKCKMQMIELGFGHWDLTDLVSCFVQLSSWGKQLFPSTGSGQENFSFFIL